MTLSARLQARVQLAHREADRVLALTRLQKTPPVDVEAIADALGVRIELGSFPPRDGVSGCIVRTPTGTVIGVNQDDPLVRRRFTIAHELGHYILHEFTDVHVDSKKRLNRDDRAARAIDPIEIEANAFAAALLMPRAWLEAALPVRQLSLYLDDASASDEIRRLARAFKVSEASMQWRLSNLGFLQQ